MAPASKLHQSPTTPAPRDRVRALMMVLVLLGIAGLGGCELFRTSPRRDMTHAAPYPEHLPQLGTLDIQVIREGTTITLTNTTAHDYRAGRIWINRWYSHPIDRLGVAESITLDLFDFRDEFGDAFRGGGFFATQDPDAVVHAQLETTTRTEGGSARRALLGLVVVESGGQPF